MGYKLQGKKKEEAFLASQKLPASQEATAVGLEFDDEVGDSEIALLLEVSEDSSPEEDLALADPEQVSVQLQGHDHLLAGLLAIHESLGNHVGSQELVALPELLERDPIGEALAADSDAFQDTIAPQLIQDQGSVDLASPLLVIGDDATDEVGVGVAQGDHQLAELLLVQLGDGPEHSLPGPGSELGIAHGLLAHAHDLGVLPHVDDEGVLRGLQLGDDVLVQRVHVLHQPLLGGVVDLAGVVDHAEVGLAPEVRLHELGVGRVRGHELLHEGLVGGLGEPALLVDQRHDAHRLQGEREKMVENLFIFLGI